MLAGVPRVAGSSAWGQTRAHTESERFHVWLGLVEEGAFIDS
jgi:hypothetical protein